MDQSSPNSKNLPMKRGNNMGANGNGRGAYRRTHELRPKIEGAQPRETSGGRWCVKECCGMMTVIFVYFFILWPVYFLPAVLTEFWNIYVRIPICIIFILFALGGAWSHWKCMTSNPGTVPLRTFSVDYPHPDETLLSDAEGMRYCMKCDGPKPPKAHHCSTCKRCILKMDHHCPWMNNCIGMYNLKYFMLFLMYIALQSFTAIGSIAGTFATCNSNNAKLRGLLMMDESSDSSDLYARPIATNQSLVRLLQEIEIPQVDVTATSGTGALEPNEAEVSLSPELASRRSRYSRRKPVRRAEMPEQICNLKPHNVLFSILLGLEALVFGLFTTVMFIDALQMASTGESQIDEMGHKRATEKAPHQLKLEELRNSEKRTCKLGLQEFCGSKPSIKWAFPVRGCNEEYFRGLTDADRYVLSTTYWDRYVIPQRRSIQSLELGSPKDIGRNGAE